MGQLIGLGFVVALIVVLVWIFMRAAKRDREGVKGTFWPQSAVGQLGLVVLLLLVAMMIASAIAASQ